MKTKLFFVLTFINLNFSYAAGLCYYYLKKNLSPAQARNAITDLRTYSNALHKPRGPNTPFALKNLKPETYDVIKKNIYTKVRGGIDFPDLWPAEYMAIIIYKMNGFAFVNSYLRRISLPAGARIDSNTLENFITLLVKGMSKLPTYNGSVKRFVKLSPEQISKYIIGETITNDSFTSTAKLDANLYYFYDDPNVKFLMESKTGVYIDYLFNKAIKSNESNYISFGEEKEVLFYPGTSFRVKDRYREEGKIVIHLQEI